jgi:hypothetical protein
MRRAREWWWLAFLLALSALLFGGWLLLHGVWREHAHARSPDGTRVVESRNRYSWGPIYGWNHFYVRVLPRARIRCTSPTHRWRDTPADIVEWRFEHAYATYNDLDGNGRFPASVRWVSDREFVIEGGEGSGARFEVER